MCPTSCILEACWNRHSLMLSYQEGWCQYVSYIMYIGGLLEQTQPNAVISRGLMSMCPISCILEACWNRHSLMLSYQEGWCQYVSYIMYIGGLLEQTQPNAVISRGLMSMCPISCMLEACWNRHSLMLSYRGLMSICVLYHIYWRLVGTDTA